MIGFCSRILLVFCLVLPAYATEDLSNGWTASTRLSIRSAVVNGDLTDLPVFVDLSHLPDSFFSTVKSDGSDIRISNGNTMTQVPVDLVNIDTSAKTGELWFKADSLSSSSDTDFYLYYGNGDASFPAASATFGSQSVWANGYVAVYHMNESPEQDGARQFTEANNEYFSVADNADLSVGDIDFTIAAWVYLDSKSNVRYLVGKYDESGANQAEYQIDYSSGSDRFRLAVEASGNPGGVAENADVVGSPVTDKWYFIVAWHDSVANTINIQIDDGTIDSGAHSAGVADSDNPFGIGFIDNPTASRHMDGRISKVGFWKRTLSAAEKSYLYNRANGRQYRELGLAGTNGSALKTSLVSYWDLNEGSGNAIDLHGSNDLTNANTVTATSGPSSNNVADSHASYHGRLIGYTASEELDAWQPDSPFDNGYSLEFEGTDDYVNLGTIPASPTDKASIAFWAKPDAVPSGQVLVTRGHVWSGWAGGVSCYVTSSNNLTAYFIGGGARRSFSTSLSIPNDSWSHVALVWNGTNVTAYVNGSSEANTISAGAVISASGRNEVGAKFVSGYQDFLDGKVDDVRFYNDLLSSTEVDYLRTKGSSGLNPGTANLVAHWDFDDGPGQIIDSSPNKNHGRSAGIMNGADLVSGQMGNAIDFDGSDDYVGMGDVNGAEALQYMTVSTWAYPHTIDASDDRILTKEDAWYFFVSDNITANQGVYVTHGNSGSDDNQAANHTLSLNKWQHLVATYDNGNTAYFTTGLERDTDTNVAMPSSSYALTIATRHSGGTTLTDFYDGLVDEVRISNLVRSHNWISTEYNNQFDAQSFYLINGSSVFETHWSRKNKITIQASQVNGDLADFPVYINLADMPTGFFTSVKSDGGDIRVTTANKINEVPHELVSLDTNNGTGELWFKADMLDNGSDTEFYIFYGNSSASAHAASDTYGSQNVWSNGFVAVWHLGEDGNTNDNGYRDSTSNANHANGVSMTASSDVAGIVGKAQDFDGNGDYLNISGSQSYAMTAQALTASMWFYQRTPINMYGVLLALKTDAAAQFQITNSTDTDYNFMCAFGGNAGVKTNVPTSNNWHKLSLRYSGAGVTNTSSYKFYIDGVDQSLSTTPLSGGATNASAMAWRIGGAASNYLNGRLDEVRVSNIERSADWIKTEYNNQSSPSSFYKITGEGGLFDWQIF